MKQFLSTLALLALISSPAYAQKKKSQVKVGTPATTSAPVYSYSGGSTAYSHGPAISVAGTFGGIGGTFVFGPTGTIEWPTTMDGNDFSFGGRLGFYFGSNFWTIPVTGTAKYHLRAQGTLKPYVGAALGLSISHVSFSQSGFGLVPDVSYSDTSTHFVFLVTPGVSFGEGGKLFAELPLGTIASGFAILPTFGYHF